MGTVYSGSTKAPVDGDLLRLVVEGAQWLLLDIDQADVGTTFQAALSTKLNVILKIGETRVLPAIVQGVKMPLSGRIVIAVGSGGPFDPSKAQAHAEAIRNELKALNMAKTRIIVAAPADEQNVMDYFNQADIDGVLVHNTHFGAVTGMLRRIALHCS
jgi:triosephosphate isomerase